MAKRRKAKQKQGIEVVLKEVVPLKSQNDYKKKLKYAVA